MDELETILINDLLFYNAMQIQDAEARYYKSEHYEKITFKKYFDDVYIVEHAPHFRGDFERKYKK